MNNVIERGMKDNDTEKAINTNKVIERGNEKQLIMKKQ